MKRWYQLRQRRLRYIRHQVLNVQIDSFIIKGEDKQKNIKHVFEWISLKHVHALIYIYIWSWQPQGPPEFPLHLHISQVIF